MLFTKDTVPEVITVKKKKKKERKKQRKQDIANVTKYECVITSSCTFLPSGLRVEAEVKVTTPVTAPAGGGGVSANALAGQAVAGAMRGSRRVARTRPAASGMARGDVEP